MVFMMIYYYGIIMTKSDFLFFCCLFSQATKIKGNYRITYK